MSVYEFDSISIRQKIPRLLDVSHRLIEREGIKFVLSLYFSLQPAAIVGRSNGWRRGGSMQMRLFGFNLLTFLLVLTLVWQAESKELTGRPQWELTTAPLEFIAKWYPLDVAYRLSQKISIGPAFVFYNDSGESENITGFQLQGYGLGLNANYYFQSASKSSWYLSGHLYYESFKQYGSSSRANDVVYNEMRGVRGHSTAGYQWRISSFALLLGAGIEVRDHASIKTNVISSTSKIKGAGSTSSQDETVGASDVVISTNVFPSLVPRVEMKWGFEF